MMPKALATLAGFAVLTQAVASCASAERIVPTPPITIGVFLRKGPVPGGCAAFTLPQLAHVVQGKGVVWHITNISCDGSPTVEFEFDKPVIEFEREQCPATAQGTDGKRPVFCFQARGKVVGKAGRHKYKVKLSTGFVEDPEVDIYPPPGS